MKFYFDEDDWSALTASDKKALRILNRTTIGFEALSKSPGVGQDSIDSLIKKRLVEEGAESIHGRTFRVTPKGSLAFEWIQGNRMREIEMDWD